MTAKDLKEEKMVGLMRNALLVAGHEMGEEGDHWPVINSTIHSVMKDWENLKVERAVDAEMKKHLYAELHKMEVAMKDCTEEEREKLQPLFVELKEVYDAYFDAPDQEPHFAEEQLPVHLKRAQSIISVLEE